MSEAPLYIDATFFLGMHDGDEGRRRRSLSYFAGNPSARPRMNFEQIGICDAIIWTRSRQVQDLYYPFMDRLHTDMAIVRGGYSYDEIQAALGRSDLTGLAPEQAFLVGQVLWNDAKLATHDPVLLGLECLRGRHWHARQNGGPASFPRELQALYEASLTFAHQMDD